MSIKNGDPMYNTKNDIHGEVTTEGTPNEHIDNNIVNDPEWGSVSVARAFEVGTGNYSLGDFYNTVDKVIDFYIEAGSNDLPDIAAMLHLIANQLEA